MTKDDAWAARQLRFGLAESAEPAPESEGEQLVEVLQEILLLAGKAIAERAAQEANDED